MSSESTSDRIELDVEDLTIAEVEEVEELTGLPFDSFSDPKSPKAKFLRALVFLAKRRENPDYTWEDAGKEKLTIASPKEDDS